MIKLYKSALCAMTALGLCLPTRTIAQTTGGGQGVQELQEIVVTARRVEERLETVPISISVFNQKQLTDRNVLNGSDLATYTPSLTVSNFFGTENATFALRGFSQAIGTPATVGIYFGDVVAPRGGEGGIQEAAGEGAGPGDFFDLQNVQVLKGPQGTLFGRNTTGGAIVLVPEKPTPEFGGYLEAGVGNYNMEHIQGVINVPINDKIRIRAGVDQETRDGYMQNISGVGPSDFNNIDYVSARVSLVVDITDDIQNYTIGSFSRSDNNGPLEQVFGCDKSFLGSFSCDQITREKGKGDYVGENDLADARIFSEQWQVINTTTWDVNDDFSLKNTASYAELTGILNSGLFGNNWLLPSLFGPLAGQHFFFTNSHNPPGFNNSDQSTVTEELQAHGDALDGKLRWQGGLYWEGSFPLGLAGTKSPLLISCSNFLDLQCVAPLGIAGQGEVQQHLGTITYRDYAVYGQATYSIFDNLKFTAGLRVTDDSTTGQTSGRFSTFFTPPFNVPAPPKCIVFNLNPSTCLLSLHTSSRAPTWVLGLDYNPIEDLLTYVKYTRGYRTGGLAPNAAPGFFVFQPETVDTYELGTKYSFRGQVSGFINAAAFYNDFQNQQVLLSILSSTNTAAPTEGIENLGSSRIFGLELDSTLVPYKGLTLNASYTYLNSKILTVQKPPPPPSGSPYDTLLPGSLPGYPLDLTPKNKLTFTATYQLPLDESYGKVSIGTTYTYTSSQYTGAIGPFAVIPGYDLLNLNIDWEGIFGRPVDAEFFMTNVAGNVYANYVNDLTASVGFASRFLGEPRMFGGRIRVHFGGGSEPEATSTFTPPPVQAPAPPPAPHSYLVFFDFDKSDLTPQATQIVDDAAKNAGPAHATRITCVGHTDTVGSAAYNMRLSKRRAESVAAELEKQGVPSSEIEIVAKGKADLLVPTSDGVREPQNRRVQIVYDAPTS